MLRLALILLPLFAGYQAPRLAPRLTTVVPPTPPLNVIIGNTVLAIAEVNATGAVTHVRLLQGLEPFAGEAVQAISRWHFDFARLDGPAVAGEVSVLMMFRPHSFGNAYLGGPSLGFTPPEVPKADHPVLPHFIFDPGWPVTRLMNEGVVAFELDITETGRIDNIRTVRDIPGTAEIGRDAVRQWEFTPAMVNGKPVQSRTVVAISFVQPVLNEPSR